MKKHYLLGVVMAITASVNAQPLPWAEDNAYLKRSNSERKVIPWPNLIESNVMYHWRVERIIDVRLKQNKPMQWPKNPLSHVIKQAIEQQRLKVYSNPEMTTSMDLEKMSLRLNHYENIQIQNDPEDIYNLKDSSVFVQFDWDEIQRYKIMEDWIFDKKEGRMYCRICYIAPMYRPYAGGVSVPEQPAFYIRYYDNSNKDTLCFRNVAVNQDVFNAKNVSHRMSYDDWFEMRMFSGYIIQETNVFNNRIAEFDEFKDDPIAAMLEGQRADQQIFLKEMDMWEH